MHGRDLRSKSLSVVHGETIALHPTDLDIAAGELFVLLGPSGSGKTSLLRTLAGFRAPALGRISIGGTDVTDLAPEHRPTAMIFASLALFPSLSVADNVAFALEARGVGRATRRARARELVDLVGLTGDVDRRPGDLAEADRRRVALARALAAEPAVLLLDDPFAALDRETRRRLRTEWKAIQRTTGTTVVLATDDRDEALALADRLAVLNAGRIEQVDTPDRLYARPDTAFVARFVGEVNNVAGRVVAVSGERIVAETPLGRLTVTARGALAPGDAVEILIRPERLLADGDRLAAEGATADPAGWNRLVGDLVGRTVEGATVVHDFAVGATHLTVTRANLGLRDALLANLHAIGFHADEAFAFPAPGRAGGGDG